MDVFALGYGKLEGLSGVFEVEDGCRGAFLPWSVGGFTEGEVDAGEKFLVDGSAFD